LKKSIKILILLLTCALLTVGFSACGEKSEPNVYLKVTLDYADGEREKIINIKSGEVLPEQYWSVSREGYTFAGWYDGEKKWKNNSRIEKNLILTARWNDASNKTYYSVSFMNSDNTLMETILVEEGKPAATTSVPYLDEYHRFERWSADLSCITGNITVFPIFDYARTDAEYFTFEEQDGSYIITGAKAELPSVLCLPEVYNERQVIGIANAETYQNGVFALRNNLTKIYVPKSYQILGDFAFYKSKNIVEVYFEPDSELNKIGVMSFFEVYLDTIALPSSVADAELVISMGAFMNCYYLSTITLSEAVVEIGVNAFNNAGAMTSGYYNFVTLNLPQKNKLKYIKDYAFANVAIVGDFEFENLVSIGDYAFSGNMISTVKFNVLQSVGQRAFYPRSANGTFQSQITSIKLGEHIKKIGAEAFAYSKIFAITLPDTLANIGDGAFMGSEIVNLDIPTGISEIGTRAFYGCEYLSKVIYRTAASVADGMFENCILLSEIEFLNNVTEFGDCAFKNCFNLADFDIPIELLSIGDSAFEACTSFTEISLLNVSQLGTAVFKNCTSLQSATINLVKTIPNYTFSGCTVLDSVFINSQVNYLGNHAFNRCMFLEQITLPSAISHIGESAFEESGITSLRLPSSINFLGKNAFRRCTGLTEIVLPADVGKITFSDGVLSNCNNMSRITVENGNAFYSNRNDDGHLYNNDGSELVLFVSGTKTSYTTPDTLKKIGKNAFSGNINLQIITIGHSVEEIGDSAFSGSSTDFANFLILKKVDFSNATSLKKIGAYAFYNCGLLTEIDLSACISLTSIGDFAFYNCNSITKFALPNSIKFIGNSTFEMPNDCKNTAFCTLDLFRSNLVTVGENAFKNFDVITAVRFPSTLTEIGENAFLDCTYLSSLELLATKLTNVPNAAFKNTALTEVVFPATIEAIGIEAFSDCKIQSLDLLPYTNIKTIGSYCFYGNELNFLRMSPTITYIGSYAFAQNSGEIELLDLSPLTRITTIYAGTFMDANIRAMYLPETLKTIESKAFAQNPITSLTIPSSVTAIRAYAFADCGLLNEVYFGEEGKSELQEIGEGAFNNCTSLSKVVVYSIVPPTITHPVFSQTSGSGLAVSTTVKIYVMDTVYVNYVDQWSDYASQIYIMSVLTTAL